MSETVIGRATAADLDRSEVLDLYAAVGWTGYTASPEVLFAGLAGSTHIAVARLDLALIGLARVISDGATIAYLQDVLVHPDHQRRGLGRRLIETVLEPVARVRQKVLLTDDEPATGDFYARLGWPSETPDCARSWLLSRGVQGSENQTLRP